MLLARRAKAGFFGSGEALGLGLPLLLLGDSLLSASASAVMEERI
jgi:hypothetical protein